MRTRRTAITSRRKPGNPPRKGAGTGRKWFAPFLPADQLSHLRPVPAPLRSRFPGLRLLVIADHRDRMQHSPRFFASLEQGSFQISPLSSSRKHSPLHWRRHGRHAEPFIPSVSFGCSQPGRRLSAVQAALSLVALPAAGKPTTPAAETPTTVTPATGRSRHHNSRHW